MNCLLRKVLLWFARNVWLRERLPQLPFMQKAVHRFMPGEAIEDALGVAAELQALGSGPSTRNSARASPRRPGAQAVPTTTWGCSGGSRMPRSTARSASNRHSLAWTSTRRLFRTPAAARRPPPRPRAPTSGSTWRTALRGPDDRPVPAPPLVARPNTGICLQAYLRRTAKDVERLLPLGPDDPPGERRLRRAEIDRLQVEAVRSTPTSWALAVTLLRESRTRPMRVGLGTHDVELIEQIAAYAGAAGVAKHGFEVQMLYGIRVKEQRRLARSGYRLEVLIAYGAAWYPGTCAGWPSGRRTCCSRCGSCSRADRPG